MSFNVAVSSRRRRRTRTRTRTTTTTTTREEIGRSFYVFRGAHRISWFANSDDYNSSYSTLNFYR
jgi:hypothetical protein